MLIVGVQAIPFGVPYPRPARFASGAITHGEHVLVRLVGDDGTTGHGEAQARPYTGWTLAQALAALPALRDVGAEAAEELLPLEDRAGRRRVAETVQFPIVGDESCRTLGETAATLECGLASGVSVKAARTALLESRCILELAAARGAHAYIGSQYEGAIGAFATAALASSAPQSEDAGAELTNAFDVVQDVATPPVVADGYVVCPDLPGLGFEVDAERLAHLSTDRRLAPTGRSDALLRDHGGAAASRPA